MGSVGFSSEQFARRLNALAELCVTRGLNLQHGQELIVSAPLEAASLVQEIARSSYARGAKAVICVYDDPQLIRDQIAGADEAFLSYAPGWVSRGVVEGIRSGAARLRITGPYPELLSGIDVGRIGRFHQALAQSMQEEERLLGRGDSNWCMLPYVTASWAKQVFPELAADVAQQRLWEVVLEAAYVVESGSMHGWDAHLATLDLRCEALQGLSLRALRFFDGRTDLTVELAKEHRWQTASVVGANGVRGVHTIPGEELFASLGRLSAIGRIFFSRPIALGGTMVERLFAEFDRGKLVRLGADRGADAFEALIGGDERSRGLCEVGLVAASSPLARSGTSYWNPLLDRNAASHVTFGPEKADGESGLRIDCMIGHADMHVDGVMLDGEMVPVMREGEFVAVASAAGGGGVFVG